MNAEIKLNEAEVIKACEAYIVAQGWAVDGKGKIVVHRGCNDPREQGDSYDVAEFVCKVRVSGRASQ